MKARELRICGWLLLAAVLAMMLSNVRMGWLAYSLAICALLVGLLLLEFQDRHGDARWVALTGVLVALTVASRQLIHGIEFTPVFTLVIVSGRVFGFTVGFTVGALAMLTSNFFIGQGPWTPFQMLGLGLAGAFASALPGTRRFEIALLTAYSVAAAYFYGVFTDVFSWIAFVPTHTLESFGAIAAAGMLSNTARAVGNVFFMAILGPVLIKSLGRFRKRLTYRITIVEHGKG
jgi:energy-coupling factor transport system substrate-specific component